MIRCKSCGFEHILCICDPVDPRLLTLRIRCLETDLANEKLKAAAYKSELAKTVKLLAEMTNCLALEKRAAAAKRDREWRDSQLRMGRR